MTQAHVVSADDIKVSMRMRASLAVDGFYKLSVETLLSKLVDGEGRMEFNITNMDIRLLMVFSNSKE